MLSETKFNDYISNTFHTERMEIPLFYSFPIGIRFEIGVGSPYKKHRRFLRSDLNNEYFENCFIRAQTLLDAFFDNDDDIFLVVDNVQGYEYSGTPKALIINYDDHVSYPYRYDFQDAEDDEAVFNRYIYKSKMTNIDIPTLLVESIYYDFPMKHKLFGLTYLINVSKKIIYHLYDDRGLDVIASNKAALQPVYNKFNDWILDYDREKIDALFKPDI